MNPSRIVALLGLVVGCGGGAERPATTTPVAAPAVVELGEVTLYEGDDAVMKIHADGSTEIGYRSGRMELKPGVTSLSSALPLELKPGPTIRPDGTFEWKGDAVVRLNADGTFTHLKRREPVPIVVTADTARRSDREIGLDLAADGAIRLVGGNPEVFAGPLRIVGADTPGKRRAILAFAALQLLAVPEGKAVVVDGPTAPKAPGP